MISDLSNASDNNKTSSFRGNLPIIAVLLVSAFLNIWGIWKVGFANKYYAAGVYSMGQNLHAFFFNSLDSIGFVTIDKPPLGFWIQVLFTKVFGFSGAVLILPQAIASVVSVYLIYRIIKTRFSKGAGLVAAAVLALTPIYVAVSRNNTIDGILILMLVLAGQQALLAAEKSSMKHLIFAGIFIGLGFNIKMMQAYVIVPAIYLTYLIFAQQKFMKKIMVCALSFVIMLAISLSWVVAVDLVPEENRPYIGSSETNSAVNLAIGYNGLNRIIGKRQLSDNITSNTKDKQNINTNKPNQPNQAVAPSTGDRRNGTNNQAPNNQNNKNTNNINPNNISPNNTINKNSNKSSGGEFGESGIFRLFNEQNAGQIAWFLLGGVLTCVLLLVFIIKGKFEFNKKNIALLFFSLCFVPLIIYFSFSSGVSHRYYLATVAPFLAGLISIGYYYLVKGEKYWILIVFALIASVQLYIQFLYNDWAGWLFTLGAVMFIITLFAMIIACIQDAKKHIFTVMLCTLFILPAIWSATPIIYEDNTQLPISGPELSKESANERDLSNLIEYLEKNREGADYLAVADSSMSFGAELILQSGEPVIALGGFNGSDSILELNEFVDMVKNNEVKYAVLSQNISKNQNQRIYQWIYNNGQIVRSPQLQKNKQMYTVYKLD